MILIVIGLIPAGRSLDHSQGQRFAREALAIDEPFILTDRTQLDQSLEQARKVIDLGARRLKIRSLPAAEATDVVIMLMSIEERFVEAMEEAAEGSVIHGRPVAGIADELCRAVWKAYNGARSKTAKSFIELGIAGGRLVPCNRRQPARMTPAEAEARKREEDARRTMEKILRNQQ